MGERHSKAATPTTGDQNIREPHLYHTSEGSLEHQQTQQVFTNQNKILPNARPK